MIFLGLIHLALLHLCVQGVVPVNVETVFVIKVTPQSSTDSFVNVMTAHVTAHYQAFCAEDMVCVIVDGVNVMQVGLVLHVTVEMM